MPPSSQKPVLIVEDDAATRLLLRTLLRRDGYTTAVASDGREAIALLNDGHYSCVILDVMMPQVDGWAVVEFVNEHRVDVPIIICTAAGPKTTEAMKSPNIRAVVRKPFDIELLSATVRKVALAATRQPRVLIVDDDERTRYVLREMIDPAEAVEAESADIALPMIRERHPDLILLDLTLPGMSGEELLQTLSGDAELEKIPVIVVTSRVLTEAEREGLRHASDIVDKAQLSRDRLARALATALRRRESR